MPEREDRFRLVRIYIDRALRTSVLLSGPITLFSVATLFYALRSDHISFLPSMFSVATVYPLLFIWFSLFGLWTRRRDLYEKEIFGPKRLDDDYLMSVFRAARRYEMYCLMGVACSLFLNVLLVFLSTRWLSY